jgi:two-component system response regulator HupR/HoxA
MTGLPTVLVVDDEIRSQEALRRTLEEDFEVHTASSAAEARAIMERETVHIVLTDQRMPEVSGVEFLKQVREQWPDTVRLIISGYTDSEDIIAGINEAGIYQYLLKPWHPEQLLLTLKRAAELQRLEQENRRLALELRAAEPALRRQVEATRARVKKAFDLANIVRAPDSPMNRLCDQVARAAGFDVAILLSGESGTGKELLARAIHYASPRADQAFIVENCGALPDTLLESELFGHKKGAYTGAHEDRIGLFQQAHGGTLFLDEIGETSPAFQVKLLRVLQEGEFRPLGGSKPVAVDVRVIAATNRDLETEVQAGRFREDLYYRLATVPLRLPALRERRMDIPLLAQAILAKDGAALGRRVKGFGDGVLDSLAAYAWPGNVRELQNEILRMLVLSDGDVLGADALAPQVRQAGLGAVLAAESGPGLRGQVDALEAKLLDETLARHRGNVSRAAQELGLSRLGLRNKLTRLGLDVPVRGKGRPGGDDA